MELTEISVTAGWAYIELSRYALKTLRSDAGGHQGVSNYTFYSACSRSKLEFSVLKELPDIHVLAQTKRNLLKKVQLTSSLPPSYRSIDTFGTSSADPGYTMSTKSYATLLFAFVIFYDNLERPTPTRSLSPPPQLDTMRWSTKLHNTLERIKFGIRGTTLPSGMLPYEIWLLIVDAVVDDLESTVEPLTWVLTGYESEKVTDENRCLMLDQSKPPWSHRIEHFLIDDARNWEKSKIKHRQDAMEVLYNFTLVNRRTREIINRRLPRCTFLHRNWFERGRPLEKPSTSIRIVPSIDQFPYFVRRPAPHSHMKCYRAVFGPWEYHGCVEPFSHVQTVLLSAILLRPGWVYHLKHHFQYLQKMPSLRSVEFRAKRPYREADETTYYTVEDSLLTFLPGDENLDMDEIISMWRSLKDRGVRFTASHSKALVEFT
ncbi:uncharacterized protein CLUP02_06383 [Colletotrichum lupini]|uniref:Uncharacterized protein n=1 Tax=Colletotrichum lupini TaxID=145971 RepID=A0A9Q8SPI4_9PEZI|nr:uncharacterized protein CLUP02_06383 [Colletotrichum lupini]UQC80898.1 hypothetical protein CLUP02_06383 [Colletotrichum lupini]